MQPPLRTALSLSLGLLMLPACAGQPTSVQSADPASGVTPPVSFEADLLAQPGLVPEADKPLVLEIEPEGQKPVMVRYARGVEEEVRWEGAGDGVLELHNEHGQLIYRVSEGGEAFSGMIPAGLYTLTVRGGAAAAPRDLVLEPAVEGTRQHRVIFWRKDSPGDRGGPGMSFDYVSMSKGNFIGQMMVQASFRGARVSGVQFAGANMVSSTAENSYFRDCNFNGADMSNMVIGPNTVFMNCSFKGANLSGSSFEVARIFNGSMQHATLAGASFFNSRLTDTNFAGANLLDVSTSSTDSRNITGVCFCSPSCGHGAAAGHFM